MSKVNFDIHQYCNFIKEQSKIIRNNPFDKNQISLLYTQFLEGIRPLLVAKPDSEVDFTLLQEALSEFALSTQIAYSKYRLENKNLWAKIFGFSKSKLPEIKITDLIGKS